MISYFTMFVFVLIGAIYLSKTSDISAQINYGIKDNITKEANVEKIIVTFQGKKYDITNFAKRHPGGKTILVENNGNDIEEMMAEIGHSDNSYTILKKYEIQ